MGLQSGALEALPSTTAPHKAHRAHVFSLEISLIICIFCNVDNWQNCACDCTCIAGFLALVTDYISQEAVAQESIVSLHKDLAALQKALGLLQFPVLALEKHDLQQFVFSTTQNRAELGAVFLQTLAGWLVIALFHVRR